MCRKNTFQQSKYLYASKCLPKTITLFIVMAFSAKSNGKRKVVRLTTNINKYDV